MNGNSLNRLTGLHCERNKVDLMPQVFTYFLRRQAFSSRLRRINILRLNETRVFHVN